MQVECASENNAFGWYKLLQNTRMTLLSMRLRIPRGDIYGMVKNGQVCMTTTFWLMLDSNDFVRFIQDAHRK